MNQSLAPVISNNELMPGVYLIWLESPQIASTARPGQFVMVHCGEETLLRRPLSIHQIDEGKIALLFAKVGKGTNWLSQRQTGDTVDIFGPLGNGFTVDPASKNLLLIAGGIGLQNNLAGPKVRRRGIAHAAQVDNVDSIDMDIHRPVRMTDTHQIGLTAGHQIPHLCLSQVGVEPHTIMMTRRGMDTQ